MHHSLRVYSKYREFFLKYYIWQAKWVKICLIGRLVRKVANLYGNRASAAYLLTLQEANEIVDNAVGLAVGPCTRRAVFHNCDSAINTEIMLGLSRNIFIAERPHDYREITSGEAKAILKECHLNGLIHTVIKCRKDFYSICNCCSCCCVPLRLGKLYGIANALARKDNIVEEFKAHQLPESE